MKVVNYAVSDAARLLQGDISVLLPPPSSGKNFVEQVQKMWRTGKRLYGNASDLVTMIKTLSGVSLGSDLQPRGVWKTDSKPPPRLRSSVTWLPHPSYDRNQRSGVCRYPIACANNFRGDADPQWAVNNTRAEHRLAFRHASGTEQCTGGEKHG